MSNSEFADLYIQKCNEAQVLGRSAANTDCGNCIELHKLNASNCAALLDDVNLRGRLLEDPNLDADNIVEKIVAYEATRKTGQNRNSGTANSARSNNRGNNNRGGNNDNNGNNNRNRDDSESNVCTRCLDPNHKASKCIWRKKSCTFCGFTGHSSTTCDKLKKAMDSGSVVPPTPAANKSGKSGTTSRKFKGKGKANMIAGAEEEESSEEEDNGVIHHVSSAKHAPQTLM